jgi:predicted CoA-binding protein
MADKLTLVIGASTDAGRYANKAIKMLRSHGHSVVGVGRDKGTVADIEIKPDIPQDLHPDTVTLYINPIAQRSYYDKILALKPRRVIFNPGTENDEFETMLEQNSIIAEEACTLVLLSTNQF